MQQPAVLVIDDEGPYSRVVAEVLQRKGFRVRTAAHGPSGLFAAKRDHPDLILLDIMMPEMDGLAVVRKIGAAPAWRGRRSPSSAPCRRRKTARLRWMAIEPFVSVEMAQDTIEHAATPGEKGSRGVNPRTLPRQERPAVLKPAACPRALAK